MLLWQRQNSDLSVRGFFVSKFFLFSTVCHVVGCFLLFFLYKNQQHQLLFDLSHTIPSQAQVRLLPLSMSKPVGKQVLGVKNGKKGGKATASLLQQKKEVRKKSSTTVVKQKNVTALSKKTKLTKNKSTVQASSKKDVHKKQKKEKSSIDKKHEAEKKLVKEPVKEIKNEPVIAPEKEIEQKAIQELIPEKIAADTVGVQSAPEGQEYIYVTQQELDALQISQKLQECLFDLWTIPVGIPSTVECQVTITIGWDGVIVATEYLKKSMILMYDLSVQEALEQVQFPHEVWGKQITIVFKP